jgi:hypothetical protein
VGGIMGKSWNDYIKVIKLPLAVWIFWDIAYFVIITLFPWAMGGAAAGGAVDTGTAGMLLIVSLSGLLAYLTAGFLIGWNTVKIIRGSYIEAVIAATIVAVISTIISFILSIISSVITGGVVGLMAALLVLAAGGILGLVITGVIAIILALIGVFVAKMMMK